MTSVLFSEKFRPDYGLLLELHALTLVARSYALLYSNIDYGERIMNLLFPCSPWGRKISQLNSTWLYIEAKPYLIGCLI